ncbi:helix-turn-helix domain-containing protein [Streptomyces sp. NPDC094438]|uniref:helix-turn-helix domain-containing protein n=1 Tax=Streptomyces sp. NPDC094438 TaxID=3366061 RepID=UPI003820A318
MTDTPTTPDVTSVAADTGPTARRRQLGFRLLALRRDRGLSAEEAGERAGMSKANVSRYEQSKGNVRWNQVDALCRVYGVSDAERQELIDLAKNSKVTEGWWVPYHGRLSAPMQMLLPIENESSRIRQLATNVVPGLLQTLLYAQAIKATPGKTLEPEDAGEFLDMRMYRQKILDRASPPDYHVLLDESVLRRAVGGPVVMAEQLDLLLERGQDVNIQIQVLPFDSGAYSAALSSFIVYGGPDPLLDVIFIENTVGSLFLEEEGAREAHVGGFDFLCREALDPDSSAELIAEARKTHLRNRN